MGTTIRLRPVACWRGRVAEGRGSFVAPNSSGAGWVRRRRKLLRISLRNVKYTYVPFPLRYVLTVGIRTRATLYNN